MVGEIKVIRQKTFENRMINKGLSTQGGSKVLVSI